MARTLICAAVIGGLAALCMPAGAQGTGAPLPHRWFYCSGYRQSRQDVDRIKSLIRTAADHGLNGVVLDYLGLDSITRWGEEEFALFQEVADVCRQEGIELIPTGFSVGYGGGALWHDRNFAAALPVTIRLEARGSGAIPVPGPDLMVNGDLEQHEGDRFTGFDFHDQPGEISFAEAAVAASGTTSIRFENLTANEHGHGRIMQRVAVAPGRCYRFSFRIRTEDLEPVSGVQALVLAGERTLASTQPGLQPTQDWTDVTLEFITVEETEVRVYAGIWGGRSGRFWIDDMQVRQYGTLADIVRREGTPLGLRSLDRDTAFVEGRDFEPVENRPDLEALALTPGTSVREGERLELDCYKTPFIGHGWGRQISLCMSNPALYDYWESQARRLHEVLPYKRFLLSMDEIRNGGGCLLCKQRGMTMAEILGDCFTRQRAIFKAIDPDIEVLTWSDMLDPNHNAHDDYYHVVGDFTGSWRYVPKDLVIMCWWKERKAESLAFFSAQGFRTMGACYYDADDLSSSREWLDLLTATPGAQGIMYTSWERKYDLLAAYGDMVSGR
ncbi:MAG: hypothetical protein AMK73_00675 [Planctomycetes bacterium SM23_32]|nr:MAG: hypothetical protein AMK73_00675 [Planctomycetes bacterium SM23_32]